MVKMTEAVNVHGKDDMKEAKEINTARTNLNRHLYSCLLAIPSFRYRIKPHKKDIPNTEIGEPLWPIAKSTLNAKCSQQVDDLFELAYRPKHFAREHLDKVRHSGQGPYEGGHWASPAALTTPMRIRLTNLAVPRRCCTKCTKKYFGHKLTERQRKLLDTYIDNSTKTIYYRKPKKRMPKPKPRNKSDFVWPHPKPKPKGKKKKSVPNMERLSNLATPKVAPKPTEIPRGKKVDIDAIAEDLTKLATPPDRFKAKKVSMDKYFKVKPGALAYNISDRVAEISQPKPYLGEPPHNPYIISRGALHYEATDRVKTLATPLERKPPPTDDIKEEPFAINPIALKAMCTPRTAELAIPRKRK